MRFLIVVIKINNDLERIGYLINEELISIARVLLMTTTHFLLQHGIS